MTPVADDLNKAEPGEHLEPRLRIFQATMAVALRRGFGKITMDTVAREAGFSKGGLLYHFKTKNHLVAAMLEHYGSPASQTCGGQIGMDPFLVAMLIAAADNPALLEPFRARIGGSGPLTAALLERFSQARQPTEAHAFAVRHKGAEGLFGLFVAQGLDALWDMVDEFSDPAELEYRLVEGGALIVTGAVQMSGQLSDVVEAEGNWSSFDPAEEASGLIARVIEGMEEATQERSVADEE